MITRQYCVGCGEKSVETDLSDDEILGIREGSYALPVRDCLCPTCLLGLDLEVDLITGRAT